MAEVGARIYRRPLQAWQRYVADVAGEYDPSTGDLHYPVAVVHVPRRAGKTALVLAKLCRRLLGQAGSQSWYTAQTGGDAGRTFRREWLPALRAAGIEGRLKVSLRAGAEALELTRRNASVTCFPPIETALHGTNVDEAVIDEAWSFDLDAGRAVEQAVFPAQLTRPGSQTLIVSAGGTMASTWLDDWLERAEAALADRGRIALFEWGADPAAGDYDPRSPATWWTAHPALGDTIREADIADELARSSDLAAFERSILNVWPRPRELTRRVVTAERWAKLYEPRLPFAPHALAFDASADRSYLALAAAGVTSSGRVLVEVVEYRTGTLWGVAAVRSWLAAHPGGLVACAADHAGPLADQLEVAGVEVLRAGPSHQARACATLVDQLTAGALAHRGQEVLDQALDAAPRRPMGDGWAWKRTGAEHDPAPLIASTLAVWVAVTHPRPPAPFVVVSRG